MKQIVGSMEFWAPQPEEVLFKFTSPGFSTRYPSILNHKLIPDNVFALLDSIWKGATVAPRECVGYLLKDVWVVGDGLVFDNALRPFEPAVWPSRPENVERDRQIVKSAIESKAVEQTTRRSVLCRKPGNNNYGHWLLELLPRALFARGSTKTQLTAIVHSADRPLAEVIDRSLELSEWPNSEIIRNDYKPYYYKELVAVTGLTHHGRYMSPLVVDALTKMANNIDSPGLGRYIYVKRSSFSSRKLLNEDKVQEELEHMHFVTVEPGSMTLDEQICVFREADTLVGVLGAELTNIAFCRPGTKIIVLAPQLMPDTFFWFIAQHRNLEYIEIRCHVVGDLNDTTWRLPIIAPIDQILALLN